MILKKIKCYQLNNNIKLFWFKGQILTDLEKV